MMVVDDGGRKPRRDARNSCSQFRTRRRDHVATPPNLDAYKLSLRHSSCFTLYHHLSSSPMAVRWSPAALLFALIHLYTALLALAADGPFDCHPTVGPAKYDLTSLKGEHTMSRTREMPPSSMEDIVTFDLCAEIQKKDGVPDVDQVRRLLYTRSHTDAQFSSVSKRYPVLPDTGKQKGRRW